LFILDNSCGRDLPECLKSLAQIAFGDIERQVANENLHFNPPFLKPKSWTPFNACCTCQKSQFAVLQRLSQTPISQGFQCCRKLRDIEPDLSTTKHAKVGPQKMSLKVKVSL
jgi:hypothetical protein